VELAARGPGCPARGDVILAEDAKTGDILDHLGMCLSYDFDVKHSTRKLDTPEHMLWEAPAEQAQL
jgi:hypothetical protein